MLRTQVIFVLTTLAAGLLLACQPQPAAAATHVSPDGRYSVQIETGGSVLPVYTHRGSAYILGQHNSRYGIRVFNHTARRIEAVVTVDGRDVITGERGDYRTHRGYIIAPSESVFIEGFRRSWDDVAAFYFTDPGDAYATRRGDPANLGVIGVAVFEERRPRKRRPRPQPIPRPLEPGYDLRAPAPRGGASTGRSGTGYPADSRADAAAESAPARQQRPARQQLGTGYGHETYSPAVETVFKRRRTKRPSALLELFYDSYDGLRARGIRLYPRDIRPVPAPEPDPFPNSPYRRFAPSPYN